MAARWIAAGIVAAGLCGVPALAAPKVDALGSVGDVAKDPVTACADLAAIHLLGTQDAHALGELWHASWHFATALAMENLTLYPVTAAVVQSISAMEERHAGAERPALLH